MSIWGQGGGDYGGNDKGYYATSTALISAHPVGQAGWYAIVGATDTIWVWDTGTSAWVDSGASPSSGALLKSNNLSELTATAATARTNIVAAGIISANVTYTVKTSGGDYTTVQDALDFLQNYNIVKGAYVTISIDAGVWTPAVNANGDLISLMHPQGGQIKIVGAATTNSTITSFVSASGSAGNYSVALGVADTTGMIAGDYVGITSTTGTGEWQSAEGCWKIISTDSSTQITVKNTYRGASFPAMTLTGGNIKRFATVIKMTHVNDNGFKVYNNVGLGGLYNLAIVGDGSSSGQTPVIFNYTNTFVQFGDGTTSILGLADASSYAVLIYSCMLRSNGASIVISNIFGGNSAFYLNYRANVSMGVLVSNGNTVQGIYVRDRSNLYLTGNTTANGNSTCGLSSIENSHIHTSTNTIGLSFQGNNVGGLSVGSGCGIYLNNSIFNIIGGTANTFYLNNNRAAIYATEGGQVRQYSSPTIIYATTNSTYDFYATLGAKINISGYTGTPVCQPVLNQTVNDALIYTYTGTIWDQLAYLHATSTSNPHAVTAAQAVAVAADGIAKLTVANTAPLSPTTGDAWIDTSAEVYVQTGASLTLDATHTYVVCNRGTAVTVSLPVAAAAFLGKIYTVKNIGAGTATLQTTDAVNIDSATSASLVTWASAEVKLIDTTGSGAYLWIII